MHQGIRPASCKQRAGPHPTEAQRPDQDVRPRRPDKRRRRQRPNDAKDVRPPPTPERENTPTPAERKPRDAQRTTEATDDERHEPGPRNAQQANEDTATRATPSENENHEDAQRTTTEEPETPRRGHDARRRARRERGDREREDREQTVHAPPGQHQQSNKTVTTRQPQATEQPATTIIIKYMGAAADFKKPSQLSDGRNLRVFRCET